MNEGVRVLAAISAPRLGFTDNMRSMMLLQELGIPSVMCTGAYWDRSLQKCFDYAVEQGFDYVLTVDYDCIFSKQDVMTLLNEAVNSELSAIAPLMAGRGNLGQLHTVLGNVPDTQIIPVESAHFGLTVISTDALDDVRDCWVGGNIDVDPDVQFWEDLKEEGHQAYVHQGVGVGHLELMIKWPGGTYGTLDEWYSNE